MTKFDPSEHPHRRFNPLIGEHTDYNDGFVLPCAIDYGIWVAVSPRTDRIIEVLALGCNGETNQIVLDSDISFHQRQMWCNYVRGIVKTMSSMDYPLAGCNIAITGNVPQGAGLSSSASLEVAVGRALAEVAQVDIDLPSLARFGQQAENEFVGCACGIMDQLVSACGEKGKALLVDCRDLSLQQVPLPPGFSIVIVNSNVQRGLVDSEYNLRRQQCEQAAAFFGKSSLRSVTLDQLEEGRSGLDPVIANRALHVLSENQRTLEAADALSITDIARLSTLIAESHESMRELFEITVPPVDALVSIISSVIGVHGDVRMTGGGFGGCVVALVPEELVGEVTRAVEGGYRQQTGLPETIYLCRPVTGARLVELV